MARLQILELPAGPGDEPPPFLLVIDQAPHNEPLYQRFVEDIELNDFLGARTGARTVLVFEDTIDIPANDTTAYLADERTDIALDMATMTNALGVDQPDEWGYIRRAAADLRHSRDSMRDAIQRVRDLPEQPESMDAQHPDPFGYLHGYRSAIRTAKQATKEPEPTRPTDA